VRTGAAVGAGFRVLGEGDLDADKRAHIIGLTYARHETDTPMLSPHVRC
jgi:hypothetical protein